VGRKLQRTLSIQPAFVSKVCSCRAPGAPVAASLAMLIGNQKFVVTAPMAVVVAMLFAAT